MSENQKRPGRPPLTPGAAPARVHVSLSATDYDKAHSIARREGVSVPELVRRGLTRVLSDEDDD
jgi:hypothetical protein